jgi:hypothetical protein
MKRIVDPSLEQVVAGSMCLDYAEVARRAGRVFGFDLESAVVEESDSMIHEGDFKLFEEQGER